MVTLGACCCHSSRRQCGLVRRHQSAVAIRSAQRAERRAEYERSGQRAVATLHRILLRSISLMVASVTGDDPHDVPPARINASLQKMVSDEESG